MFVCWDCCVLSGRGLRDELISRPEESYRLWCVVVSDLENLKNEEAMTRVGSQRHRKRNIYIYIYIYITCGASTQFQGMTSPYGAPRSHSETNTFYWFLWMSDQTDAESSISQHTTLTRDRQNVPPAEWESAIPAKELPQTHALDRTDIGKLVYIR